MGAIEWKNCHQHTSFHCFPYIKKYHNKTTTKKRRNLINLNTRCLMCGVHLHAPFKIILLRTHIGNAIGSGGFFSNAHARTHVYWCGCHLSLCNTFTDLSEIRSVRFWSDLSYFSSSVISGKKCRFARPSKPFEMICAKFTRPKSVFDAYPNLLWRSLLDIFTAIMWRGI